MCVTRKERKWENKGVRKIERKRLVQKSIFMFSYTYLEQA